jgi:hypothetical protein
VSGEGNLIFVSRNRILQRVRHRLPFLLVLVFVCPLVSKAQIDGVSLGPYGSFTFGTPLDIDRQAVSTLGSNGLGTSSAQTFGAGLELSIPTFFSKNIGLSLIGKYSWSTGEFTSLAYASSDNSSNVESTQQFHLSSRYGTPSVALLAAFHLSDRWDLGLGGEFGYRVQDALTDWREILSPAGVLFVNSSTRDTVATGSAISSTPFRVAIPVFVGYTIPLGNGISLTSRLFGAADLNEIFAGYSSQSFSAGISLSLLFGKHDRAANDVAVVTPPPPASRPEPPSQPALSQPIPQSPPKPTPKQPIQSQSISPPPSPAHILASIHLEINGVAARSALVREVDTLIETFTALPEHVRVPKAESRLVHSYIVPDLSVSRFVESEEGVRGWKIRISQAGTILSEYSSDDSVETSAISAAIELGGAHGPAPILAELTVTNTQLATRSVWDTLSLIVDTTHIASRIEKQSYLFLPRATADLRHQDSLLIRNLLSSLDTSGILTISPLTSKGNACPEQDSLSSFVLSGIRASFLRPRRIELLDQPAIAEQAVSSAMRPTGDCGIIVRYVRGE